MANSQINQHKRLAMGEKVGFKLGGPVMPSAAMSAMPVMPMRASRGVPMSPLEIARRNNGIPGFKAGGKAKGKSK